MSDATPTILTQSGATACQERVVGWMFAAQVLLLGALLLLIYRTPLDRMVYTWGHDGNWSHGWLVPFFSIYLLAVHRSQLAAPVRKVSMFGLVVLIGSLGLRYFFLVKGFGYPQQVLLIVSILGLVLFLCGWRVLWVAWFPVVFLMCAIPFPQRYYFSFTIPLRKFASQVSGSLLGLLPDVHTEVQGVIINYVRGADAPGHMNVEEACSGMRLLMAFCTLGLARAYLGDRPWWHRVVMVTGCIPIAVFCNMIRVCATGMLTIYGYEDWAGGTAHQILGLAMLPIALGLFALIGFVLKHLFVDVPDEEQELVQGSS